MLTLWFHTKKIFDKNTESNRVGTASAGDCETIESRLVESVNEMDRSKQMIFVKTLNESQPFNSSLKRRKGSLNVDESRCFNEERNIEPPAIELLDLSMKYIKFIDEDLMEREKLLRKDILLQHNEIQDMKKSLGSNEAKQNAKYNETKERLNMHDKKRKEILEKIKLQHHEARRRLERLENRANLSRLF